MFNNVVYEIYNMLLLCRHTLLKKMGVCIFVKWILKIFLPNHFIYKINTCINVNFSNISEFMCV